MSALKQFVAAISAVQRICPDLRVGQIISNAASVASGPGGEDDIYYLPDDALTRAIERYAARVKEVKERNLAIHSGTSR